MVQLIKECSVSLAGSQKQLLEILFALAQDDWPDVQRPCIAFLRSSDQPSTSTASARAPQAPAPPQFPAKFLHAPSVVPELCMELVNSLHSSLQRGEQEGTFHGHQLCTALQVGRRPSKCLSWFKIHLKRQSPGLKYPELGIYIYLICIKSRELITSNKGTTQATLDTCFSFMLFQSFKQSLVWHYKLYEDLQNFLVLQAAGFSNVQVMLRNPGKLAVICDALVQCFAFEPAGASLLLYAAGRSTYSQAQTVPATNGQASLRRLMWGWGCRVCAYSGCDSAT